MEDFEEKLPLVILRTPSNKENVQRDTIYGSEVLSGLDPVRRRPGMYTVDLTI